MRITAKKYYWLKLPETFFRQKDVRGLRRMQDGAELVIIYQKIMLDSIGYDGRIRFENYAPTLEDEIADNIGEDSEKVKAVLDFMKDHQLIEKVSDDEYELPGVISLIGSETEDAARMRHTRSKKDNDRTKSEQCSNNVQKCSNNDEHCYTEKRREEKDIERDTEKNKKRGEENPYHRNFFVRYKEVENG